MISYPLTKVKGYIFMTFYYSRGKTTATGIMQKNPSFLRDWVYLNGSGFDCLTIAISFC